MKRAHRTAHRLIWPLLALIVGSGLVLSLALRAPPQPSSIGSER